MNFWGTQTGCCKTWTKAWLICVLFYLTTVALHADSAAPSNDDLPASSFDDRLSTNWLASVRNTLPADEWSSSRTNYHSLTNSLYQQSRKGDMAAQALWGLALIVSSPSPEAIKEGVELMRESAEKGDVPAMMNLGTLYSSGKYVRKDYNEAFRWYKAAADVGNAEAQLQLGGCFHYGLGTTPDNSAAIKYYRRSAEQTNYVAMKSLGYALMKGYGGTVNETEAKHWFFRAANEGGNRRAMYNLGCLYSQNRTDTNATAEGFKWMNKSAELGDALAAQQLAAFYYSGIGGVETNIPLFRMWRLKAALWGATQSQSWMGQAYRLGDGVPVDMENAVMWYRKAAAKNDPDALYALAVLHLKDRTKHESLVTANQLMHQAAQMGHREAQFLYAACCFRGDVLFDFDAGKAWLAKAAENGWPKAEFCLFELFYNGIPPATNCPAYPKDAVEAIKWLRRAAEHGSLPAQYTLASMQMKGRDVSKDKVEAARLLRKAADQGYVPAQNDLGYAILHGNIAPLYPVEGAVWSKLASMLESNKVASKYANRNFTNAFVKMNDFEKKEVEKLVQEFKPKTAPEMDPKVKGWENNPAYQQEDGRFGH